LALTEGREDIPGAYLELPVSSRTYLRRRDAAAYLRDKGARCSEKYLAKLACIGGGPVYRLYGRTPLYAPEDLDAYFHDRISGPMRSTSEYGVEK
jgi:hypothetical protein